MGSVAKCVTEEHLDFQKTRPTGKLGACSCLEAPPGWSISRGAGRSHLLRQLQAVRYAGPMCSNYEAVTRADRMLAFFGVVHEDSPSIITFPTGLAPFIRLSEAGKRQAVDGHFGLLPHFAKELTFGRRTYNARSETVATLPSFRDAWRRGQRCIVPAEAIFEPSYETGKAVRWRIWQPGEVPTGIAGIWTSWRDPADQSEHFCIDPAEPAQVRPLMRMPQRVFSCSAPGAGADGCRSGSSPRSGDWHAAAIRSGADARIVP